MIENPEIHPHVGIHLTYEGGTEEHLFMNGAKSFGPSHGKIKLDFYHTLYAKLNS